MNSPAVPISVKVSAIAHATEDSVRIEEAMRGLWSMVARLEINSTRAKGHYGNQITSLVCTSKTPKVARRFLENTWKSLSQSDRARVYSSLMSRIDDSGTLFVRLSKQDLVKGKVVLHENDPVKIEISFRKQGPATRFVTSVEDALDGLESAEQGK